MNYTASEVIQYIQEEDIKFIRLAFCDIYGIQKNTAIMPYQLERAFVYGMPVDATAISGFGSGGNATVFVKPDPSTLSHLPWRPEAGGVVRMFCDVVNASGQPIAADCRSMLKKAVEKAASKGIHFEFGTSMEFYLFKTDDNGNPTREPHDNAGYMDIAPVDKGENIRRQIQLSMEQMGIQPESSHHEHGPGQNEIDFVSSSPLASADNAVTFVSVVKTIAASMGLAADFSPKPMPELPGSGLHIRISLHEDSGKDILEPAIAGIMDKIRDMTLFLDPAENSYERLGRSKAPRYITWSDGGDSHLVRIRKLPGCQRMAELRSLDALANPYLAFTLLIEAGIYGVENNLRLCPRSDFDPSTASSAVREGLQSLPSTIWEARDLASKSGFIRASLPESIIKNYCGLE